MIQTVLANIKFELNIRVRSISTYAYFSMFFALSMIMGLAAGGAFEGVTIDFGISNKVFFNSGTAITLYLALLSAFSLFITAPAFGQAVVKDYANGFDQIIYSTPVNRTLFLISRFVAALIFMILILTSMGLGIWAATYWPTVLKTSFTTNHMYNYLSAYLTIVIPNLFVFGSIFFLLATKTKKMGPIYIAAILIFMGWMLSGQMVSEIENKRMASLSDPFGITAAIETTRYWSNSDHNSRALTLQGFLLENRLLWFGIGLICFLGALTSYRFGTSLSTKKPKVQTEVSPKPTFKAPQWVKPDFSLGAAWQMSARQVRLELSLVFKSIYFQALLLAGVAYMFVAGQTVGHMVGTNTYPVTYMILSFVGGSFDLFIVIIVTFIVGEIVWRDRDHRTQQIVDASPVSNFVLMSAKFVSLLAVVAALLSIVLICGVAIQAMSGYTNFELPLYFRHLYTIRLISYVNIVALAFFLQVLTNNKFASHGFMIAYYILYAWGPTLGFEHKLYNFNAATALPYSDMNQYGQFLTGYFLFKAYWLCLAMAMLCVALMLWQRGTVTALKSRVREAAEAAPRWPKILLVISLTAFCLMGGYLFYNTNILNSYLTEADTERLKVAYETKYVKFKDAPQLMVTAVKADVDLFPYEQSATLQYLISLKNRSDKPMDEIFLNIPRTSNHNVAVKLSFNVPTKVELEDPELGVLIYKFDPPLAVGKTIELKWHASVKRAGIPNSEDMTALVYNGTFLNNSHYSVTVGYQSDGELSENKTRAKYGLAKRDRIPKIDDSSELMHHELDRYSSWIDFEATVSTAPDQIAVAPGYLQRTWEANGRKYFSYKMNKPVLNFYSFLSARYKVKKDKWHDVNLEVYYQPGHEYNLDKMIDASKSTLDYFAENYGPYQFTQYRVLEFPRYASFAQSFPNTVPFSEAIGFIAHVKPDDPKDVDFPFFVTAHELAHQWWGHQIIPAKVQGAFLPTESFAEFTALLVMEKRYGHTKMKRFLRQELEKYLSGRGGENSYESPLSLSEGQPYIHYQKGSLALFALKEYLGEKVLNSAIRDYLNKYKFQEAPFTVSTDFIDILKAKVQPNQRELVSDLLEKIVLFDNKPLSAEFRKVKDGDFEVKIKVSSAKLYADKDGKETPTPFHQDFDVGVTDEKGEYLYLEKRHFTEGDNEFTVRVSKQPNKAGVDPLNYIIDKSPDDNMINVEKWQDSKVL